MQIAKIVSSRSQIIYAARVLDTLEVEQPPSPADYAFARFVAVENAGRKIVGVIADTQLINPNYGNFGPRLSSPAETNLLFSPDYLHDQGVLINLFMLGWLEQGYGVHRTPELVLPVHSSVVLMPAGEVESFHRDKAGRLRLGYYTQVLAVGGVLAAALLLAILDQVEKQATLPERTRLTLLRENLAWHQTLVAFGQQR
ncbi:MAG: hypothetical protein AB1489_34850 [Acidobacteriota bacterium]